MVRVAFIVCSLWINLWSIVASSGGDVERVGVERVPVDTRIDSQRFDAHTSAVAEGAHDRID
jgi:hypothetical protein